LISIKRYMDTETVELAVEEPVDKPVKTPLHKKPAFKLVGKPALSDPSAVIMDCYRSALQAVGKSAGQSGYALGSELELQLVKLLGQLPAEPAPSAVQQLESDVEVELNRWGHETAEYLREKADGVKELLMMLASTTESVGERDQRYANQFSELTSDLRTIANLDDLTQVRKSLVRKATELKSCVDTMTQESQHLITQLQSQVGVYETNLKTAEDLVLKDNMTGIANRRCAEKRMEWHVLQKQKYCVAVIDLNKFKEINDQYGHAAGDDLLKQFSSELQNCMRKTDLVARWGGDEFIVVLNCELSEAERQIERIHKWTLGDYTIHSGSSGESVKVDVGASIGVAQWQTGDSFEQVVARADAKMYADKDQSRNS
jgi:diguanylate cyclase (GGDEF)-like protein